VQSELDAFFANLANRTDLLREVSAQAFAKARMQVSVAAFEVLNDHFLALVDAQFGFPLWYGLRVVAGDATVLRVTLFGKTRDGKRFVRHIVDANGFALYLPGIGWRWRSLAAYRESNCAQGPATSGIGGNRPGQGGVLANPGHAALPFAQRCGVICGIRSAKVLPTPFSPIACIFHSLLWRYTLVMIWAEWLPCTLRS
jgi:hypothetical protein